MWWSRVPPWAVQSGEAGIRGAEGPCPEGCAGSQNSHAPGLITHHLLSARPCRACPAVGKLKPRVGERQLPWKAVASAGACTSDR